MLNKNEAIEFLKCAHDPVYFLNNYGYIYDVQTQQVGPLTCFKYQEDIVRKFHTHQNNIVLKSRQLGLSVITAGFVVWTLLFKIDQRILIVANNSIGAVRFLDSVKQFMSFLPKFLYEHEKDNKTNNTKEVVLNNGNWAKAVASSKNAGRGEALTMLVLDETAFIDYADDIWMAAGMALSATQGKCIMISTPQGTGNLYHTTWVAAVQNQKDEEETDEKKKKARFQPTIIHWKEHPLYSIGLRQFKDEHGREKWTSPWYEKECERLNHDNVKIAQELDLSFEGSRALVIDSYIIAKYEQEITSGNHEPISYYDYTKEFNCFIDNTPDSFKTNFWVWKKPELNVNYIVSCDVARGDGSDFSTIQVINADTVEQVAEFQGKLPPDLFAKMIYKVGMDYNKAYLVVECNNFGLATALALKNPPLKYDVTRIHHSKSVKKLVNHHYGVNANQDEEIAGFQTTQSTRPLLITSMATYLREGTIKIHSIRLINELKTFIYDNNREGHAPGFHDDLIFALGIGLFIRDREYKNVFMSKEFYAAMLNSISFSSTIKANDKADNYKQKTQEQIKMPNTNVPTESSDEDLRWLYGELPKKETPPENPMGGIIIG